MNRLSMLLFNGGRCLTCARAGAGTVVSAVTRRLGRPRLLREFTSQTAAANSPACSQMKSIVDKDHLEHLLSHNSGEFVLVDVREREEIARDGKIPSSVNIPGRYTWWRWWGGFWGDKSFKICDYSSCRA